MKANDSGHERQISELARMLPVPAERDLPAGRQQILKENLMSELRPADGLGPHRTRWHRPARGTLVAGAAAGVAAVAVAAAVAVSSVTWHTPHQAASQAAGPHRHAAPVTAAQLLDKVAAVAARQPSPRVRGSQYEYIKTEIAQVFYSSSAPLGKPRERQVWASVRGSCFPDLVNEPSQGFHHVNLNGTGPFSHCAAGFNNPTYAWLRSLPARPHALLRMLRALTSGYPANEQDGQMFDAIGSLLGESIVPPRTSAALYRAAAMIPGVTVVTGAADAIGRPGVAVSFTPIHGKSREQWIFARNTLHLIGERNVNVSNGKVVYVTAVVDRAIVNRRGEIPPGG
jgi:hypothetical protein